MPAVLNLVPIGGPPPNPTPRPKPRPSPLLRAGQALDALVEVPFSRGREHVDSRHLVHTLWTKVGSGYLNQYPAQAAAAA
jgi:hypothetical protein